MGSVSIRPRPCPLSGPLWLAGGTQKVTESADKVELLENYLVLKMPHNPLHDGTIDVAYGAVGGVLLPGWYLRTQQAVVLSDTESS